MAEISELLPARTLAKKLEVPRVRIQEWKEAGIISFVRVGKRDKFDLAAVREELAKHFKAEKKNGN